jgi:hypothetical protein
MHADKESFNNCMKPLPGKGLNVMPCVVNENIVRPETEGSPKAGENTNPITINTIVCNWSSEIQ